MEWKQARQRRKTPSRLAQYLLHLPGAVVLVYGFWLTIIVQNQIVWNLSSTRSPPISARLNSSPIL